MPHHSTIPFRCGTCGGPLRPARCCDLPVLACCACGKVVEAPTAPWSCAATPQTPRLDNDGDVWVPSSDPRRVGRGYKVRRGVCLVCDSSVCRHAQRAAVFLAIVGPSPDSVSPGSPDRPQSTPVTRAALGRAVRIDL